MANLRQSILIRTDLGFTPGLMAAQVAHIHAECMRQQIMDPKEWHEFLPWLTDPYIFVHKVPNREVLEDIISRDPDGKVPRYKWTDTVQMNVSDSNKIIVDTLVGVSLGPCDSDLIKQLIGDLPLL